MDKELQDLAWRSLPKEFKEEVKRMYETAKSYVLGDMEINAQVCEAVLSELFGIHNLTSNTEGEEMLMCNKGVVEALYLESLKCAPKLERWKGIKWTLDHLFGSKCLPDENYSNVERLEKNEDAEPKPAEPNENFLRVEGDLNTSASTCTDTCTDYCQSLCKSQRLQIAAMAMQGILSNADRMKQYGEIAMRESENLTQLVARNAMRYADALIAESEKGGSDGEN